MRLGNNGDASKMRTLWFRDWLHRLRQSASPSFHFQGDRSAQIVQGVGGWCDAPHQLFCACGCWPVTICVALPEGLGRELRLDRSKWMWQGSESVFFFHASTTASQCLCEGFRVCRWLMFAFFCSMLRSLALACPCWAKRHVIDPAKMNQSFLVWFQYLPKDQVSHELGFTILEQRLCSIASPSQCMLGTWMWICRTSTFLGTRTMVGAGLLVAPASCKLAAQPRFRVAGELSPADAPQQIINIF